MNTYEDVLNRIPTGGARGDQGIITPIVRLATHLGYFIAHIMGRAEGDPAHDTEELRDLVQHAQNINIGSLTVSADGNRHLTNLVLLVTHIPDGWPEMEEDLRRERLGDVSNRIAWVAAFLDIELAAIDARAAAAL